MSPASFLSDTDVADLTAVNLDGHDTLVTVYPERAGPIMLARWNAMTQEWGPLAPQYMRLEWADRQERGTQTDAGQTVTIDGWLIGWAPMDIERGDIVSLGPIGDEQRAEIVQVRPAELGTQRAAFRLRLGEQ